MDELAHAYMGVGKHIFKFRINTLKLELYKMKKNVYVTPEVEVFKLNVATQLLTISNGAGDPEMHDDPLPPGDPILD